MPVLYRKYRPQTFSEVLGQKYTIQTLKNQVILGQVAHAYLFTGGRGVGKTSVARILAKAVNCQKLKDGEPCDGCTICQQIREGNFLDLVEIDAASNTGVDNIRELIEHVKFSPSIGKFKVFIIDEVHMLSKGAFNALLKTLEEPPKHTIFILATTEINKVPATIISRTQRFDFKALTSVDIEKHLHKVLKLEKVKLEPEIVQLVAQNSQGSVRDAFSLLDKVLTLGGKATLEDCQQLLGVTDITICEELLALIVKAQVAKIPAFLDSLMEKGLDFSILTKDFLEYLRKVLIFKISGNQVDLTEPSHRQKIQEFAESLSPTELVFILRLFLKAFKDLNTSPNLQIPVMLASLEASFRPMLNKSQQINGNGRDQKKGVDQIALQTRQSLSDQQIAAKGVLDAVNFKPDSTVTLEEVQKFWPEIINKIKQVNSPLANLVKNSQLLDVSEGQIALGVKFLFHKQSLENQKNRGVISEAISEIVGKKLAVHSQVVKEEMSKQTASTEVLADALKIFGGELVD